MALPHKNTPIFLNLCMPLFYNTCNVFARFNTDRKIVFLTIIVKTITL